MRKSDKKPLLDISGSRRNFVKSTALFSAGMMLPATEMNAMFNVLNDKTLKIALVGCGGRGTGAANQALKADENVQLVAMADAFEDRLNGSLQHLGKEIKRSKKVEVKVKIILIGCYAYI